MEEPKEPLGPKQSSNEEDQSIRQAVLEIMEQDSVAANMFRSASKRGSSLHGASDECGTSFVGPMSYAQAVTTPLRPRNKSDTNGESPNLSSSKAPLSYAAVVAKGCPSGSTGTLTFMEPQTDIEGQAEPSHPHGQKHTHHLVVHPHDEVDSTHQHHDGHQETVTEGQDPHQKQQQTEQGHVVEYTLDEHGNKVPVTDERRDSGYDMLA